MLKLVVYPPHFGEPSASPFSVKALCLLQQSGLAHEVERINDPRKAPKQKLPMLLDGDRVVPDSDQIRDYLEQKTGIDFDEGLSPEQRAASRAVIRMLEEHVYFAILCDRWMHDGNWERIKAAFFSEIPALMRGLVTRQIRKQVAAQAHAQGMGRHSDGERFERIRKDIDAVTALVGDKPFLFGEAPKAADLSAVAVLRAALAAPVPTETSRYIAQDARLMAYLERGREALYPA